MLLHAPSDPARAVPGCKIARVAEVREYGYCIGCGACAVLMGSPWRMARQVDGRYWPQRVPGGWPDGAADMVCPFAGAATEQRLAAERFAGAAWDPLVGYYRGLYAGAAYGAQQAAGSAGGLTTWLLGQLLETGEVDGVIHVVPTPNDPEGALFRYGISRTPEAVHAGSGSRYYPVELSSVLRTAREAGGRYALVGLPCYLRAAHMLRLQEPALAATIRYTVGLVCAHLKSAAFAEYLAWQLGIPPQTLAQIDFHRKRPGVPAHRYAVWAWGWGLDGKRERCAPMARLHGQDWGQGLFKPQACDYCDDLAAETADITFGEAWLSARGPDSAGTSLVIVRDATLEGLLTAGAQRGAVGLEPLGPADFRRAQEGNVHHRREALAYRLALADAAGQPRPHKRVAADAAALSPLERLRQRVRRALAQRSHWVYAQARRRGDPRWLRWSLAPWTAAYTLLSHRLLRRCLRLGRRLSGRIVV